MNVESKAVMGAAVLEAIIQIVRAGMGLRATIAVMVTLATKAFRPTNSRIVVVAA